MCHFVTMVLPPGADVDHVQQVLGRYHRGFEILENRFVAKLLKSGELYFLPSPWRCDCETELGLMYRPPADAVAPDLTSEVKELRRKGWPEARISRWLTIYPAPANVVAPDFANNVKKLRRKGWGEAKIARWREQQQDNWYAKVREDMSPRESNHDLDDWANIIRELRADAGLGYVGILLHWYDGDFSSRMEITRKELQFDDDIKSSLGGIEEDVLYIVS